MALYDSLMIKKKNNKADQEQHYQYKVRQGEAMVERIMSEFDKTERQIKSVLDRIYALALPDTQNPLHGYVKAGDVDNEYLDCIMGLFLGGHERTRTKVNMEEITILKAQNVKKRQAIQPIVQTSMKLLSGAFTRKKGAEDEMAMQ